MITNQVEYGHLKLPPFAFRRLSFVAVQLGELSRLPGADGPVLQQGGGEGLGSLEIGHVAAVGEVLDPGLRQQIHDG